MALPRRISRGLIEAREACSARPGDVRNFRGELAAASLKRYGSRHRYADQPRNFRGELAAASLKRQKHKSNKFLIQYDFRGELAAASLKQEQRHRAIRPGQRGTSAAN